MIKKLTKHGNSFALILDRPILDLLNIQAETPLVITTNGHVLMIAPIFPKESREIKFETALQNIDQKYHNLFKRLA
ncbi:MAG: hypothetical protein WCK42_07870 [Myxococcaceae bacterium]